MDNASITDNKFPQTQNNEVLVPECEGYCCIPWALSRASAVLKAIEINVGNARD